MYCLAANTNLKVVKVKLFSYPVEIKTGSGNWTVATCSYRSGSWTYYNRMTLQWCWETAKKHLKYFKNILSSTVEINTHFLEVTFDTHYFEWINKGNAINKGIAKMSIFGYCLDLLLRDFIGTPCSEAVVTGMYK